MDQGERVGSSDRARQGNPYTQQPLQQKPQRKVNVPSSILAAYSVQQPSQQQLTRSTHELRHSDTPTQRTDVPPTHFLYDASGRIVEANAMPTQPPNPTFVESSQHSRPQRQGSLQQWQTQQTIHQDRQPPPPPAVSPLDLQPAAPSTDPPAHPIVLRNSAKALAPIRTLYEQAWYQTVTNVQVEMTRMHTELLEVILNERAQRATVSSQYLEAQKQKELALDEIRRKVAENQQLTRDLESAKAEAWGLRQQMEDMRSRAQKLTAENEGVRRVIQEGVLQEAQGGPQASKQHLALQMGHSLGKQMSDLSRELEEQRTLRENAERKLRELRTLTERVLSTPESAHTDLPSDSRRSTSATTLVGTPESDPLKLHPALQDDYVHPMPSTSILFDQPHPNHVSTASITTCPAEVSQRASNTTPESQPLSPIDLTVTTPASPQSTPRETHHVQPSPSRPPPDATGLTVPPLENYSRQIPDPDASYDYRAPNGSLASTSARPTLAVSIPQQTGSVANPRPPPDGPQQSWLSTTPSQFAARSTPVGPASSFVVLSVGKQTSVNSRPTSPIDSQMLNEEERCRSSRPVSPVRPSLTSRHRRPLQQNTTQQTQPTPRKPSGSGMEAPHSTHEATPTLSAAAPRLGLTQMRSPTLPHSHLHSSSPSRAPSSSGPQAQQQHREKSPSRSRPSSPSNASQTTIQGRAPIPNVRRNFDDQGPRTMSAPVLSVSASGNPSRGVFPLSRKRDRREYEGNEQTGTADDRSGRRPFGGRNASLERPSANQGIPEQAKIHADAPIKLEDGEIGEVSAATPVVNREKEENEVEKTKLKRPTEPERPPLKHTSAANTGGSAPAPVRNKIGINHMDLLYETRGERMVCRVCRTPSKDPPTAKPAMFTTKSSWKDLIGHCRDAHPKSCEEIERLSPSQVAEMRQRMSSNKIAGFSIT
ncbi:hypothetical protein DXG03_004387 [Asterophora parasitica]|uniref:Uncharacterized protein n=1 Tax=Asterophora parasitica TaxID=117018 RepID=A0A9P7G439_9AGAR|nr:hypothetical protein DXG03_004387 [Asterophora parasitica]